MNNLYSFVRLRNFAFQNTNKPHNFYVKGAFIILL